MFKIFVVTFATGVVVDTKVLEYSIKADADRAYLLLNDASGKSFNVVLTKLY
jgi:hypothetical protein